MHLNKHVTSSGWDVEPWPENPQFNTWLFPLGFDGLQKLTIFFLHTKKTNKDQSQGEYSAQLNRWGAESNIGLPVYKDVFQTPRRFQQDRIRFTQIVHSVWYISHISSEQKPNIKNLYQIRGFVVPLRMERRWFEPQIVMMSETS